MNRKRKHSPKKEKLQCQNKNIFSYRVYYLTFKKVVPKARI